MNPFFGLGITLATFLLMEGITWMTHKYVMHGFLWKWHEDHHQPGYGPFQKNDRFFLVFAIPSFFLILLGSMNGWDPRFYLGLGIMAYGFAYFFVHDIFIHQRFRLFTRTNNSYFKGLRKAHKVHHKHLGKEEGECFGMLWVPWKYFMEARRKG